MDPTVRVIFLGDASQAARSVRTLEGSFGSLGRTAKIATGLLAVGFVGAMGKAVSTAVAFDKEMRNVNSLSRLNERQFKSLEKQVLSMAKSTAQAPKTLAQGLYDIVSSGFKANDALTILKASARAATAGLTDTATSTKAVVAILNAYGMGAEKASKVSSMLFKEVQLGVNTFGELAGNIGDTAPLAASLKIPFSDVAAALALITLHGTSMAEASTQVSRVMTDMLKPSDALVKTFHDLGFENGQAAIQSLGFVGTIQKLSQAAGDSTQKTADWFQNIRSLRGMLNLTGPNLQKFNEFAQQIGQSFRRGGDDVKAFNEQSKSISVQWQMAKAALAAAAVPLGSLLFPALVKATGGVTGLAESIQRNMPMLEQRFGPIVSGATNAASAIAHFAGTTEGMAIIVGGTAAMAVKSLAVGFAGLLTGMSGLGGTLSLAVAGVGLLAGGIFYLWMRSRDLSAELKNLRSSLLGLDSAAQNVRESQLALAQALLNVKQSSLAVTQAQKQYNAALKQFGPHSQQAAQALLNLQQAQLSHRQAVNESERAQRAATQATDSSRAATDKLNAAYARETTARGKMVAGTEASLTALLHEKEQVQGFAADMQRLADKFSNADAKARAFVRAAGELALAIGRIPSRKEVTIYMRTVTSGVQRQEAYKGSGGVSRAAGGFIPGPTGLAVPVLAHAGEAILNPGQVEALGGPRLLAQMFGWSGDQAAFAGGGIVGGGPGTPGWQERYRGRGRGHSKKSPHRSPRARKLRARTKAAQAALAAVDTINQRESDSDRRYGQLVREFGISQETFILSDEQGNEVLNITDVEQRLSEIDRLISARGDLLKLLDSEQSALAAAIKKLQKAIAELRKAIAEEKAAAERDRKRVEEITRHIADRRRSIASTRHEAEVERRKKKPDKALLARLDDQADAMTAQNAADTRRLDPLRRSASAHDAQARSYSSTLADMQNDLADVRQNLGHVLPFDRRDVQLDISELQAEAKEIRATKPRAASAAAAGAGGGGGFEAPGMAGETWSQRNADALIADLRERLAQLGLAVGIQQVQMPLIGAFQRGTLYVPETGVYQLHAGEEVKTRAGRGVAGQPSLQHHVLDLNLGEPFDSMLEARDVRLSDSLTVRIGHSADVFRREGR